MTHEQDPLFKNRNPGIPGYGDVDPNNTYTRAMQDKGPDHIDDTSIVGGYNPVEEAERILATPQDRPEYRKAEFPIDDFERYLAENPDATQAQARQFVAEQYPGHVATRPDGNIDLVWGNEKPLTVDAHGSTLPNHPGQTE